MSTVTQRNDGDCLRAALATLLDLPYELLPDVDHDADDWVTAYNAALADQGWPFGLLTVPRSEVMGVLPDGGRWIASVPSLTQQARHAVVMEGRTLYWDPGRIATYKRIDPQHVKYGVMVLVTRGGFGPHRDPTWQPRELTGSTPGRED